MKKKLLIIAGAGASLDFGLPSVEDVDGIFDDCAGQALPLLRDPMSNLYRYFKERIDRYYQVAPKSGTRKRVNFEEMLYQLNLLVPYYSDTQRHGPHGHLPWCVCYNTRRSLDSIVNNACRNVSLFTSELTKCKLKAYDTMS